MLEGTVETAAVMLPFNDKDFELTIFSEDHLMLLVAQSHPLAKDKKVNFKQLITERFIFFQKIFVLMIWYVVLVGFITLNHKLWGEVII